MASPAPSPIIPCDKCKQGQMEPARIARMGDGLRILGFLLWIPALVLLIGSVACGALMSGAGSTSASRQLREARVRAGGALMNVPALPRAEAEGFVSTGTLSPGTLEALPPESQTQAQSILRTYTSQNTGTTLGTVAAGGLAGLGVMATFLAGMPFLIVGLLLTRKKNVWKCPVCQSVFDRA